MDSIHIRKACELENVGVTLSINCLLGTIVAVAEDKSINSKLSTKLTCGSHLLSLIPNKIGFISNRDCKKLPKIPKDNTRREPEFINDILFAHETPLEIVNRKDRLSILSEKQFLNKIRNGIAHQNIDFILSEELDSDERQRWIGIRLWNIRPGSSKKGETVREPDVKDFEVEFTVAEIAALASYVSSFLKQHP